MPYNAGGTQTLLIWVVINIMRTTLPTGVVGREIYYENEGMTILTVRIWYKITHPLATGMCK